MLLIFFLVNRLSKEIRCRYGTVFPDAAFLPLQLIPTEEITQVLSNYNFKFSIAY